MNEKEGKGMSVRASDFLSIFFPSLDEPVHLRAFKPKGAPDCDSNRPAKIKTTRRELAEDAKVQEHIRTLNKTRGIYFIPNTGGDTDAEISRFNAVFCENDDLSIEDQQVMLDASPLPTSARVVTSKSVHAYWIIEGSSTESEWRDIQTRLITYFHSDPKIKNPARLMRLPNLNHVSLNTDGSFCYKRVEVFQFNPQLRYTVQQLTQAFPLVYKCEREQSGKSNSTFSTWDELNAELKRQVMAHPTAQQNREGIYHCRASCHDSKGDTAIMFNPATGAVKCLAKCSHTNLLRSFGLPDRPNGGSASENVAHTILDYQEQKHTPSWPSPLAPEAYQGLAGDIVRVIEPQSEADPVALLIQVIVIFGNVIGRNPFQVVEATAHYLNLFVALVGETSKGRKGTSWEHIRKLFDSVSLGWTDRITSGLSSGEGLIWAVRDPIEKKEPIREKRIITGYQSVIIDEGISDKRLLIYESEMASALRVAARDGNILTAIIRQAWDTGNLRVMTKNSPAQATDAHISVIGNITRDELRRYLDRTEIGNGFANRFLWVCVRRSKLLPEGGNLEAAKLNPLIERLHQAVKFARQVEDMQRDDQARELWFEIYEELSEGKPGLFGAVISRAEAQVMRLACIYALLDCSALIRKEHLIAALALWRYCEDSARFIFGDSLGDPIADEILRALQQTANGMTRTDLRDLFNKHRSGGQISRALATLSEQGLAYSVKQETEGRAAERWFALSRPETKATKATKADNEKPDDNPSVANVAYVAPSDIREGASHDWGEI